MNDDLKDSFFFLLGTSLLVISIASLVHGIGKGSTKEGCKYTSIATKYNPVFRLGCFLSKERYSEENE